MTQDELNQLELLLNKWFGALNGKSPVKHFWRYNPIAKIIKTNLNNLGRWKIAARGNPKRGYEIALLKQNQKINKITSNNNNIKPLVVVAPVPVQSSKVKVIIDDF
jgi:hypothetical protein